MTKSDRTKSDPALRSAAESTRSETATDAGEGPVAKDRRQTDRAFVVQLAPECAPATEDFSGRVQHLATFDGGNFASVEALIAIMRRVLARPAHADDEQEQDK